MSGKERKGKEKGSGEGDGVEEESVSIGKGSDGLREKDRNENGLEDDVTKVRRGGGRGVRVKEVRERA